MRSTRLLAALALVAVSSATLAGCTLLPDNLGPTSAPTSSATAEPSPTPSETPDDGTEAVITIAGIDVDGMNVSASGYVSGIVEDGGTCEFTFTGISGEVTVESTGIADVSVTSCGFVQAPSEQFVRGSWTVTLTYTSETTDSVSEAVALEIP